MAQEACKSKVNGSMSRRDVLRAAGAAVGATAFSSAWVSRADRAKRAGRAAQYDHSAAA